MTVMDVCAPKGQISPLVVGEAMYGLIRSLYPICRSITGDGVRETLRQVREHIAVEMHEVPTGTQVFDWTVPKEWNIRDAYIKTSKGVKVVDFRDSNLHVVSYSSPVHKTVGLPELRRHLFTAPNHPEWIPYRTSYYKESWGFCLSDNQLAVLTDEAYEVCIESSLEQGHLTYGEYFIQGETAEEILLSCHVCHPSLCNDNLSGIALSTFLAKYLSGASLRYSYRFVFIPGTIGAITWLALNERDVERIRHGLVAACVGDAGKFTYKKSRHGNATIDRAVAHVLKHSGRPHEIIEFSPYGYDERQFCSPGFDLPVGSLTRTPHGQYPEYHTSKDDLDLVGPASLGDSFMIYLSVLNLLEKDKIYVNQNPKCEPQLGKRGLYRQMGGNVDIKAFELSVLWVLNLSDGKNSLLDIANRSGCSFDAIAGAAEALRETGLLKELNGA